MVEYQRDYQMVCAKETKYLISFCKKKKDKTGVCAPENKEINTEVSFFFVKKNTRERGFCC